MNNIDVNVKAVTTPPDVTVQYKTIILKKHLVNGVNTLTQEMMSAANTKYVIKYDYVLGEDITVPANCVLEFDGGSLSDGTVISNDTQIVGETNSNATILGRAYKNERSLMWGSWNKYSYNTPFNLSTVIVPSNGRNTKEKIKNDIDTALNCGFTELNPVLIYYFDTNGAHSYFGQFGVSIEDYISCFSEKHVKVKSLKAQYWFSGTVNVTAQLFQTYVDILKEHYNLFVQAGNPIEQIYILNEYTNIVDEGGNPLNIDNIYTPLSDAVSYFRNLGVKIVFNLVPHGIATIDSRIWDLADIIGIDIYPKIRFNDYNLLNDEKSKLLYCIDIIQSHGKNACIGECGIAEPDTNYSPTINMMLKSYEIMFRMAKDCDIVELNNYSIFTITDYNLTNGIKNLLSNIYYG